MATEKGEEYLRELAAKKSVPLRIYFQMHEGSLTIAYGKYMDSGWKGSAQLWPRSRTSSHRKRTWNT
jgi:hypothetical protein